MNTERQQQINKLIEAVEGGYPELPRQQVREAIEVQWNAVEQAMASFRTAIDVLMPNREQVELAMLTGLTHIQGIAEASYRLNMEILYGNGPCPCPSCARERAEQQTTKH